jgi:hypothetical protein
MKEFDYSLNYKVLDFTDSGTRELYRIGRGEQGVLLVKPYTIEICKHWRFKTVEEAKQSAMKIYSLFLSYLDQNDFIGADIARKFLEMGFTRSRRYANHHNGRKYNRGAVRPQEADHATCDYAKSAQIFLDYRRRAAHNSQYVDMRKEWRLNEV